MSDNDDGNIDTVLDNLLFSDGSSHNQRESIDYINRLATFTPTKYFAKPLRLSPLICARFGFVCIQQDVIKCEHCKAVVAVNIPSYDKDSNTSILSTRSYESLVTAYEKLLYNCHDVSCKYITDAEKYTCAISSDSNGDPALPIMTRAFAVISKVLPAAEVRFFDAANIQASSNRCIAKIYANLCTRLVTHISSNDRIDAKMIDRIRLPQELLDYGYNDDSDIYQDSRENNAEMLVSVCKEALAERTHSIDPKKYSQQVSVVLTLLGWRNHDEDMTSPSLHCSICHACLMLDYANNDLLSRHKYYCPYNCVLPGKNMPSKPIWQHLLDCLFKGLGTTVQNSEKSIAVDTNNDIPVWAEVQEALKRALPVSPSVELDKKRLRRSL